MNDEHTPGPWEAVLDRDPRGQPSCMYRALIALVEDRCAVIRQSGQHVPKEQWNANTRLMAAAPDLLEACEYALGCLGQCRDAAHAHLVLTNAVAKARGER